MTKCKGCNKETADDSYWCHDPECYYKILGEQARREADKALAQKKAYQIMNNAMHDLYLIKELSSQQIADILEEFANHEKLQIKEDLRKND